MEGKIEEHKFIIMCGDHYNPLGLIRSLGEKNIKPIVILVALHPILLNKCKYIGELYIVKDKEEGYKLLLQKYSHEDLKPFLYTASDEIASFYDTHYDELKDSFYLFHGKRTGILTKYMNKDSINKLAIKHGCNVLNSVVVNRGELPKSLNYPVITKAITPTLYAWKDDMFICNSEEDLKKAFKKIRSGQVLIQEYIHKKNELCLDGFSYNNGNNIEIPYYSTYLRFTNICYGGYIKLKPFQDETLKLQIKSILSEIGYNGIFEVEFLVDKNDKLYFLEVNLRNSGWSYAYTYGGYNMPYLWAKATLEGKINLSNIKPIKEFTAICELDDYDQFIKNGKINPFKWFKELKQTDVLLLWSKQDKKPAKAYWARRLLMMPVNKIRKILKI